MIYGIFGLQKGGTSAVAGVLKIHGIQMHHQNTERLDDDELLQATRTSLEAVRELVEKRGDDWGFKHPFIEPQKVFFVHPDLKPIYVFRDPVASVQHFKKEPSQEQVREKLTTLERLLQLPDGLFISFEKLKEQPEHEIQRIAAYIDKPYNEKAVDWITSKKGYRDVKKFLS